MVYSGIVLTGEHKGKHLTSEARKIEIPVAPNFERPWFQVKQFEYGNMIIEGEDRKGWIPKQ